jgi:hypothetical protein
VHLGLWRSSADDEECSAQAAGRVSTSRVGPRPRPTGSQRQPCSLLARNAAQEGSVAGPRLPCARVDRAHAVVDGGWCCAARIMAEMPGKLPLRVCGLRTCPSACSGARHRADYPVSALESGVEWIEQGVVLRWAGLGSPSISRRSLWRGLRAELDAGEGGLRAAAEGGVVTARVAKRADLRHSERDNTTDRQMVAPGRLDANMGPLANDALPRLDRSSAWPITTFLPGLHACHCGHLLRRTSRRRSTDTSSKPWPNIDAAFCLTPQVIFTPVSSELLRSIQSMVPEAFARNGAA